MVCLTITLLVTVIMMPGSKSQRREDTILESQVRLGDARVDLMLAALDGQSLDEIEALARRRLGDNIEINPRLEDWLDASSEEVEDPIPLVVYFDPELHYVLVARRLDVPRVWDPTDLPVWLQGQRREEVMNCLYR